MSRIYAQAARDFARAVASSPAVAGFRPAGAALAVAAAFGLQPATSQAQPAGANVIHGQAQFVRNGNNLVVTTRNGAGTNHSAIDWQSFSVPGGSITRFVQPSASSTAINRVVGDNPSAIFGTLRSNGRLVLVNPAGIAVGKGALVDTAGFTASTLDMRDADALGGRLVFAGTGADLQVQGRIVARKGDVVLIAPHVATGSKAVIESNGATVLAAGEKVEITGRGLEGIHLEVQAPGNAAVNLGRLEGGAVGIFAGTLTHSGKVAARAVAGEGGKVILQAAGDNIVSGRIEANGGNKGQGGSIDVLGEHVGLMAGTRIEANGGAGGGSIRIGGDYQGANADVPNAARTDVDRDARIEADATRKGDGGRVIVWSDERTRFGGQISARGGDAGGDGGFAEVSGKQQLHYAGRADLRAPKGSTGTLLLDPEDVTIFGSGGSGTLADSDLSAQLGLSNTVITTSGAGSDAGTITLKAGANVAWQSGNSLWLEADADIRLEGAIHATGSGSSAPGGALFLTAMGGIAQVAGSTVKVASLYAAAEGADGVNLSAGTNQVGVISGFASGGDFRFANGQAVTIGDVYDDAWSQGGSGIYAAGAVDIRASGGLNAVDGANVTGGSVWLEATGSGNVDLGLSTVRAEGVQASAGSQGGAITIKAKGNITGGDLLSGYTPSASYGTGGAILVDASQGSVILSNVHSGSVDGNTITIKGRGGVSAGNVSSGAKPDGYYSEDGVGGAITIAAAQGAVDLQDVRSGEASGGNIKITGQQNVTVGDISSGYRQYYTSDNVGGTISVSSGSGNLSINNAGSSSGTIRLRASNGSVTAGTLDVGGARARLNGGTIDVVAGGDVVVASASAHGLENYQGDEDQAAGDGGLITITSNAGNIDILEGASANGGYAMSIGAGKGGQILLKTSGTGAGKGNITAPSLEANGGDFDSYYDDSGLGGAAGQGGTIRVTASRAIRITSDPDSYGWNAVTATGGDNTSIGGGAGGGGGTVSLVSSGGNVTMDNPDAYIDVSGGEGGPGGQGGMVVIQATQGAVTLPVVYAAGGDGNGGDAGNGGNGGNVTILAQGDITLQPAYDYSILADGGEATAGRGGNGGKVSLTSTGGSIVANSAGWQTEREYRQAEAPVAPRPELLYSGISAMGGAGAGSEAGDGRAGGDGGTVLLDAATDIRVQQVAVRGGDAHERPDRAGGNGGVADLRFGGALDLDEIRAGGGDGSEGSDAVRGGTGGSGGTIEVERTAGDFRVTAAHLFDAAGGQGGDAPLEAGGTGGVGGAGGFVNLRATTGRVQLVESRVTADGGQGGLAGSGEESSRAASGGKGTFSATGTSVDVQGSFLLDAKWLNSSTVNIRGTSQVHGSGSFSNSGTVALYDTASLSPDGGMQNMTDGRLRVLGSGVQANLTENLGKVEVAANAQLTAPAFTSNAGTLQVDGRLVTGSSSGARMFAMANQGFTNASGGLITGIGSITLDGGLGTLNNFGTIAPAGVGTVGRFTIEGGLVMQSGSTLAVDIAADRSHDVLRVTGHTVTGGTIAVNYVGAANFRAGDPFDVLQSASLDAAVQPTLNVTELSVRIDPDGVVLVANTPAPAPTPAPTPAPSPAPTPAPTPAPGQAPGQAPAVQQVNNQVVQFAQLFFQEARAQQERDSRDRRVGKDDIVLTDTQCKP